jgi:hypothetical protein
VAKVGLNCDSSRMAKLSKRETRKVVALALPVECPDISIRAWRFSLNLLPPLATLFRFGLALS